MRAIGQLREAAKSGAAMNHAVRHHRDASAPVPSQRDILLAQLAVGYLQWTADLLTRLDEAAVARPEAAALVQACQQRISTYFATPGRWPVLDGVDEPLRSLIPAYYAMRAVQRASRVCRPPLLEFSCGGPEEVLVEILGRTVWMKVSEQKNADLRGLPTAVQPDGEYRSIHVQRFPSSRQQAMLDHVRASLASAAVPPAPVITAESAQPVARPDETVLWSKRLAGTLIVLERTNSGDSGYAGSTYVSRESFLHLYEGDRYLLNEETMSRVTYAGMTVGGPSRRQEAGAWTVVPGHATGAYLRLVSDNGEWTSYSLDTSGGALVLDGRARVWTGRAS